MASSTKRLSNIELLRIIAIFFILICHANGRVFGIPSSDDIRLLPISSVMRIFFESFAISGVDIFILISGWFGIHPKPKGIGKLLYQVAFLLWTIYIFFLICGKASLNLYGLQVSMTLTNEYWFVVAYLGLYIFAPALNAFVEKASKRELQILLISFYAFQCYYCWLTATVDYYTGYSVTFFCGLYLTARYVRMYPVKFIQQHSVSTFFLVVMTITIIAIVGLYNFNNAARMLRYDSPLVIISAIAILYAFGKIQMRNKLINHIALSCFAVYIIHFNPFVYKYFEIYDKMIYNSTSGLYTIFAIGLYLIVVFLLCVAIDQIRLVSWNMLLWCMSKLNKRNIKQRTSSQKRL